MENGANHVVGQATQSSAPPPLFQPSLSRDFQSGPATLSRELAAPTSRDLQSISSRDIPRASNHTPHCDEAAAQQALNVDPYLTFDTQADLRASSVSGATPYPSGAYLCTAPVSHLSTSPGTYVSTSPGAHLPALQRERHRGSSLFPPRSPQNSSSVTSRPFRSPKRTISFDFPSDLDPRHVREIHRQVMHMALQAGSANSVKIVEEACAMEEEEEEPIPVLQLQDPPKPKFKRQLSSDSSPPDKLSAPPGQLASPPHPDNRHQGGHVPTSCGGGQRSAGGQHVPTTRSSREGNHSALPMSPKRLKAQHGGPVCPSQGGNVSDVTRDRHAMAVTRMCEVKQLSKTPDVRQQSKNSDVVHIFAPLGEAYDIVDNNNDVTKSANQTDTVTSTRSTDDDTDSQQTRVSDSSIVSVLNPRSRPRSRVQHTASPTQHTAAGTQHAPQREASTGYTANPQQSMQTLQMLFKGIQGGQPPAPTDVVSTDRGVSIECGEVGETLTGDVVHSPSSPLEASSARSCRQQQQSRDTIRQPNQTDQSVAQQQVGETCRYQSQTGDAGSGHAVLQTRPAATSSTAAHSTTVAFFPGVTTTTPLVNVTSVTSSTTTSAASVMTSPVSVTDTTQDTRHLLGPAKTVSSDIYVAQLTRRLDDIQRRIFSPVSHQRTSEADRLSEMDAESHTAASSATELRTEGVSDTPGHSQLADQHTHKDGVSDHGHQDTEDGSLEITPGPTTAEADGIAPPVSEPDSRTARLCRSKENPFTFTPRDIEKAQASLQTVQTQDAPSSGQSGQAGTHEAGRAGTPHIPHAKTDSGGQASMETPVTMSADVSSAGCGHGPLKLGQLWITAARQGKEQSPLQHRQLSDPGITRAMQKPHAVVERVKKTTLRQFSAPVLSRDKTDSIDVQKDPVQSSSVSCRTSRPPGLPSDLAATLLQEDTPGTHSAAQSGFSPGLGLANTRSLSSPIDRRAVERTDVTRTRHPFSDVRERQDGYSEFGHGQNFTRRSIHHTSDRHDPPWPPGPGEVSAAALRWTTSPGQHMDMKVATMAQSTEDDSVFEDAVTKDRTASPFRVPGAPACYSDTHGRVSNRSAGSIFSFDGATPRPALRSQSNVEQSPNQAELEAMARYKYLRSFSEHISDPQRLVDQLRARPPADCDQLLEQLQGLRARGTSSGAASEKVTKRTPGLCASGDRRRAVRRTLFPERDEVAGNEDWPLGCYTFPPPLTRRLTFDAPRDLRRSPSWSRDADPHSGSYRAPQPGDIDVILECTQATPPTPDYVSDATRASFDTQRQRIENSIQQILQDHLQIRPSGRSQADMDEWFCQTREIMQLTQEASQLIDTLSQHHRSVYDVVTGSVVIKVNCPTLPGVLDLWRQYRSGSLQRDVNSAFGGRRLLRLTGVTGVKLRVTVPQRQYLTCLQQLGASSRSNPESSGQPESNFPSESDCLRESSFPHDRRSSNRNKHKYSCGNVDRTDPRLINPPTASPQVDVTLRNEHVRTTSRVPLSPCSVSRGTGASGNLPRRYSSDDRSARKAFSELNLSDGEANSNPSNKSVASLDRRYTGKLSHLSLPHACPSTRVRYRQYDVMNDNRENIT